MTHIFIINPFAGQKTFADDLRTKLAAMDDLKYFVFNTRYAGYETDLVKRIQHIFEGEKLRFYCCGGSGTMQKMLSGFDDLSNAEIAFFPCGYTNDFLKIFGRSEHRFHHIEELINGDVIKVDYIRTDYGTALNTFSTGLDSNCVERMDDLGLLYYISKDLPYFVSTVCSIFISKTLEYDITIDGDLRTGKFAEVFFGNGCAFGGNMFFSDKTNVSDGIGITRIIGNKHGFPLLRTLMALMGKKYERLPELMECGEGSRLHIRRTDGHPFTINLDGELVRNVTQCNAEIIHKGLNLVVPSGVTV